MAKSHKLWLAITAVSALTSAALAQNVCTGKADGQIACINPTTFTICAGGAITPTQSTALGTACCQDTITSINDAKCISICSGVPIGNTVCVSSSSISICTSSGPSIAQPCAPGTICCGTKCVFPSDSSCGQPAAPITTTVAAPVATTTVAAPIATTTAAAPVITEVPGNPCAGQPDGKIACLSATTFNICSNQALVNALPQTCPGTTVLLLCT
ncbi:hypothetical protein BC829DRAFT_41922 [Chytridium lagenaria]|nr:hypothetical protein BC829DRAFT_41922 [Chytridium lagenaria]